MFLPLHSDLPAHEQSVPQSLDPYPDVPADGRPAFLCTGNICSCVCNFTNTAKTLFGMPEKAIIQAALLSSSWRQVVLFETRGSETRTPAAFQRLPYLLYIGHLHQPEIVFHAEPILCPNSSIHSFWSAALSPFGKLKFLAIILIT